MSNPSYAILLKRGGCLLYSDDKHKDRMLNRPKKYFWKAEGSDQTRPDQSGPIILAEFLVPSLAHFWNMRSCFNPFQHFSYIQFGGRGGVRDKYIWNPPKPPPSPPLPSSNTVATPSSSFLAQWVRPDVTFWGVAFQAAMPCQLNGQVKWLKELFYVLPVSVRARPKHAQIFKSEHFPFIQIMMIYIEG